MKVVVLSGGFSEEQYASRESAADIASALEKLGHIPLMVEFDSDFADEIRRLAPDVVFHIVQGKFHGDGTVQSILEKLGIPYVGSRPRAAAIINHKTMCKKIWSAAGINTPAFFEFGYTEHKKEGFAGFIKKAELAGLSLPIVVKAPSQGSRYGIVFVKDESSFNGLEDVFKYDSVLLAERYVEGRFVTQGFIGTDDDITLLPPVEILDDTGDEFKQFYGEDLQYKKPNFTDSELDTINRITLEASRLVGASCFARLDYHISNGDFFLLEINAVPGLRRRYSDLLKCASLAGYGYEKLIEMILATAK